MSYLILAGLALAGLLLATAVAWIVGWLFFFWQIAVLFGVIPYYLIRAAGSVVVWAVRLVRGGSKPTVTIIPPRPRTTR